MVGHTRFRVPRPVVKNSAVFELEMCTHRRLTIFREKNIYNTNMNVIWNSETVRRLIAVHFQIRQTMIFLRRYLGWWNSPRNPAWQIKCFMQGCWYRSEFGKGDPGLWNKKRHLFKNQRHNADRIFLIWSRDNFSAYKYGILVPIYTLVCQKYPDFDYRPNPEFWSILRIQVSDPDYRSGLCIMNLIPVH